MFWVMLFLYIATTILSGLLAKAPKIKASSLGELQAPTAEEGRNLPVIFGTCLMKAPNVVWYGDYKVAAIKKRGSILGIVTALMHTTIGYKYYLGMDLALCHGQLDELVDIRSGTGDDLKHINWSKTGTNADGSAAITADDPKCFGGDTKEGGLSGKATFYYGSTVQASNAYMSAKLGITYPAYHGVCHMVLNQWYLGTSVYIKPLAIVGRRCPSNLGLLPAQVNINGDANPAEIIYDCLRERAWALGVPPARFDVASFAAAGVILAAEGMGISLQLDQPQDADAVIAEVLRHIDGVCYTDPATGLWTLKLVRAEDPATLPEFGPDDILELEFTRGSWEQTINEMKVNYTRRDTFKTVTAQAQESANYATRGERVSQQVDYLGFSQEAIAQRVATRDLRAHSYPLGQGRAKINRKAWALRMGSGLRLTWPALGISQMAVRVTSINYGALENGSIEVEIVEDVFSVAYTVYPSSGASGWTNPAVAPVAPVAQVALESPYQLLPSTVPESRVLVGAVRGDGVSEGYEVWADEGVGYYQSNEVGYFCPSGLLAAPYPRSTAALDAAGFTVTGTDLDQLMSTDAAGRDRGDSLLLFADTGELCAWQGITDNGDGSYTITNVVRGVYDTLPADHAGGARVYFVRSGGLDWLADYKADVMVEAGDSYVVLSE